MNSLRGVDGRLQFYAESLISYGAQAGFHPRITSGVRSRAQQTKLYQDYLRALEQRRPALPAAPPGRSKHEYGLAVDIVANSATGQAWMGRVWRSWGLIWGGDADPVHFELP